MAVVSDILLIFGVLAYFSVIPAAFVLLANFVGLILALVVYLIIALIIVLAFILMGGDLIIFFLIMHFICTVGGIGYWLKYEKGVDWL